MRRLAALTASLCFLLAAFAWVPPGLDRAGLALIGLAFLALAVGRPTTDDRPTPLEPEPMLDLDAIPDYEQLGTALREQLAAYGMAGGRESDAGSKPQGLKI